MVQRSRFIATYSLGIILVAAVVASTGCDPVTVPQVEIRGTVTDLKDGSAIAGAQVQVVDASGADAGSAATTDTQGRFAVKAPEFVAAKQAEDVPAVYTLRATAASYEDFPSPARPAPALDMAQAQTIEENGQEVRVFENASTAITLIGEVLITGHVLDLADGSPIAGALVQAVDIEGAPAGHTAESDAAGLYELTVPEIVTIAGGPAEYGIYTLRCQAMGYQEFPTTIRPSLPIDMQMAEEIFTAAKQARQALLIDEVVSSLATLKLLALPGDSSVLGSISGTVLPSLDASALIVAVNAATGEAYTGFSGFDGDYAILNVPEGAYRVEGYAAGVQLAPVDAVAVAEAEHKTGIDLAESGNPLNTIIGVISYVNTIGIPPTSVVLAVESTFDEVLRRGTVPPGLRAGDITNNFSINGVPDGRYVLLAAFEDDGLVTDPDESVAGSDIIHLEVPGPSGENTITIPKSVKVTEALDVVYPGADGPEAVSTLTPTLQWTDDNSEDGYEVWVLDSFGNEMWRTEIPPSYGSGVVPLVYDGTPLEEGMYYQFRALSFQIIQNVRSSISITEDLKGVFYYEAAR